MGTAPFIGFGTYVYTKVFLNEESQTTPDLKISEFGIASETIAGVNYSIISKMETVLLYSRLLLLIIIK